MLSVSKSVARWRFQEFLRQTPLLRSFSDAICARLIPKFSVFNLPSGTSLSSADSEGTFSIVVSGTLRLSQARSRRPPGSGARNVARVHKKRNSTVSPGPLIGNLRHPSTVGRRPTPPRTDGPRIRSRGRSRSPHTPPYTPGSSRGSTPWRSTSSRGDR